jgi:predicted transposase YdaD
MKYDTTLKTLFQRLPAKLLWLLTGSETAKLETIELPSVKMRRSDLVYRLPNGEIHHFELQSGNDDDMEYRMLEYYPHLCRLFDRPPKQWVIYLGRTPLKMSGRLDHPNLKYQFEVVNIEDLDAEPLLNSDSIEDNLLAVLCHNGTRPETVRRILKKIAPLPEKQRKDRFAQLLILSGLREAEILVLKEVKKMSIEINILENSFLKGIYVDGEKRGEKRGAIRLLRRQLEERFGKLPKWALEQMEKAESARLERWGAKVLKAEKLEDVVPRPRSKRALTRKHP